jgi:hypothetical protein
MNTERGPSAALLGRHARMQTSYGFGLFALPRYREACLDEWRLVRHLASIGTGYASGPLVEQARYVLYHGRTAWMSSGLMEQESHAFHVDQAKGFVVAAGLGIGMFAFAACAKPEVERVVVLEQTPEVIALTRHAAHMDDWFGRDKLTVIHADALAPDLAQRIAANGQRPDYLFADIWSTCAAPNAPEQTASIVEALRPQAAGWWGQELSFGVWCMDHRRYPDEAALGAYVASLGVPIPVSQGYLAFCADVIAANRLSAFRARKLSGWRETWRKFARRDRANKNI